MLEPAGEPISDKQFRHLLALARLNIPDKEQETKLKAEIDQLRQFTEHIKKLEIAVDQPLTHIWQENVGQILRDDNQVETLEQARGRDLLKLAKKKSGNFYVVKGSMPSSE